jgi:selenocysteine lyase/cysteine desulfurase
MEHHSNIVPWQLLCERTGATLRWFGLTDEGRLDLSDLDSLINERTKVVSLAWVSNMLGTINPVGRHRRRGPRRRRLVVVDASQAVPQLPWTCPRWAPTSWPSPDTRWSAPPASVSSGVATTCWPRCRRSWAAAR